MAGGVKAMPMVKAMMVVMVKAMPMVKAMVTMKN